MFGTMRIAYSVGTTSFGSFPGVSLKLNGFSTAPTNDLIKNKTRNATTGTRMSWTNERLELFAFLNGRDCSPSPPQTVRPAAGPYPSTGRRAPAAIVPHPPVGL